ncbi:hypothetical protein HGK34_05435 [Myceligenerans sp. I2]|uniref:Integral membrane protein n=1 Tax=Myceligenerans indicum TaxID=2593663 RepID=A0ABS1LHK6_9MICO|nr:hypothetical protein [Myceligenerans indicum]
MAEPKHGISVGELLLAEYQSIKDEQRSRIGFRDNLLYATLAVVAAITAAAAQTKEPVMLLALPPACIVLGWTYIVNDEKISAIGQYIREELGPRLTQQAFLRKGFVPFGWEKVHRIDARRRSRKWIQCLIDLTAFCGLPIAVLAAFWVSQQNDPLPVALSVLEGLLVIGLGIQIVLYAKPSLKEPSSIR